MTRWKLVASVAAALVGFLAVLKVAGGRLPCAWAVERSPLRAAA